MAAAKANRAISNLMVSPLTRPTFAEGPRVAHLPTHYSANHGRTKISRCLADLGLRLIKSSTAHASDAGETGPEGDGVVPAGKHPVNIENVPRNGADSREKRTRKCTGQSRKPSKKVRRRFTDSQIRYRGPLSIPRTDPSSGRSRPEAAISSASRDHTCAICNMAALVCASAVVRAISKHRAANQRYSRARPILGILSALCLSQRDSADNVPVLEGNSSTQ
jgi:hypothetical protein